MSESGADFTEATTGQNAGIFLGATLSAVAKSPLGTDSALRIVAPALDGVFSSSHSVAQPVDVHENAGVAIAPGVVAQMARSRLSAVTSSLAIDDLRRRSILLRRGAAAARPRRWLLQCRQALFASERGAPGPPSDQAVSAYQMSPSAARLSRRRRTRVCGISAKQITQRKGAVHVHFAHVNDHYLRQSHTRPQWGMAHSPPQRLLFTP